MEHLYHVGKIRSIGVSNFDLIDLRELLNLTKVPVSVVQNWFDPFHQDENVREFCAKHQIHYMGYSTLGMLVILFIHWYVIHERLCANTRLYILYNIKYFHFLVVNSSQLFLGSQWTTYGGLESNPVLNSASFFDIASHYEFVVAQVILRLY